METPFTTRPDLMGTFGMVSSTHWLATAAAMAVLERGGNAFDAAVAGGLVLQVVEPHLNGPGGDLVGIVAAPGEEPRVLCGQGPAPAGATIAYYRDQLGLGEVPGSGPLAAVVPAAMDAWLLLLRDLGTWELSDIAAYALAYAAKGFPAYPGLITTLRSVRELFEQHWATSAAQWIPGGLPSVGELIRNEAWARTFTRLVDAGRGSSSRDARIDAARAAWSDGFVAEGVGRLAVRSAMDSSGESHAGVLTAGDLAGFRASWEPTQRIVFRGRVVHKAGPWCQGPALLEALGILDPLDDALLDPSTEVGAHTVLETLKLALADREAYLGDRDPAVVVALADPGYLAARRTLLADTASSELRPGDLPGFTPALPVLRAAEQALNAMEHVEASDAGARLEGKASPRGVVRGDTCHIDVVDHTGAMVSITPSGGWLQSSPYDPDLGFCLGTRLQMMWLDEDSPSALTPGKRPRTTLTPTLVTEGDEAVLACGTPGGDQQDQWQLGFLLRHLVGGYTIQQAIDAPALHTTSAPSSFAPRVWTPAGAVVEERVGSRVVEGLTARGHRVTVAGPWTEGRLCAVERRGGILSAGANPRAMQGYAAGR